MLRAPGAKKHAGTPPDRRRAPAAPERPAQRSGKGMPPAPPRTHRAPRPRPSGPQACSQRQRLGGVYAARAMARERGRGSTPGRARKGAAPPPGGAVGLGERAWRGRCCAANAGSGARRGRGVSRGRSRLPGVGWRGRPGPQRRSTNRRRTRSRQEAREGGAGRGGAGQPGNPSLSGPRGSVWGGANSLTPWSPLGVRPPGPSGISAPVFPGDPGGARGP